MVHMCLTMEDVTLQNIPTMQLASHHKTETPNFSYRRIVKNNLCNISQQNTYKGLIFTTSFLTNFNTL